MLDNFISPYDATVVAQGKTAGLVTLGKVNMDEFAMGSTSESSFYGATKNPWALDHVPGGSSGGSAAVVAADLAPFATGTDTGGSIRQPASFLWFNWSKTHLRTCLTLRHYCLCIIFRSRQAQWHALQKTAHI